jgi:hypothetical protein
MKKLARLVLIAAAILIAGSVATAAWFLFRQSRRPQSQKLVLGPPCRDGLVSVEPQFDAPMRITISNAACDNPQGASVQFLAENISSSPISQFEIRAIETYDQLVDQGSGVTTMGPLVHSHETRIGFIGGGVITTAGGKPVGPLKHYQLTVWSVTFADGKTWTRRIAA